MTRDPNPAERRPGVAEYVLRPTDAAEQAAFERRMAAEPTLEAEMAAGGAHFEGLNDGYVEVTPPKRAKAELQERLLGVPEPARVPFWSRVGLWQGLTLVRGLTLVAIALAGYLALQQLLVPTPGVGPVYVSEIAAEDDSLRPLAVYDGGQGTLQITRTAGGAALGRVLELRAIAGGDAPVSLGVLPQGEKATVPPPEALWPGLGALVLAVRGEPPGGSTTGAPTGAVLAVGQVTEI